MRPKLSVSPNAVAVDGWQPRPCGGLVEGFYFRTFPGNDREQENKSQACFRGELIGVAEAKTWGQNSDADIWQLRRYDSYDGSKQLVYEGPRTELEDWAQRHYWHRLMREPRPGDIMQLREPMVEGEISYTHGYVVEIVSRTSKGLVRNVCMNFYNLAGQLYFYPEYLEKGLMIPVKHDCHVSELIPYHYPDGEGYLVEDCPADWFDRICFNY